MPSATPLAVSVARRPSRKQARRDALFVLYQREVRGEQPERLYDELREREGYPVDAYTVTLVEGVSAQTGRLDALIGRHSQGWPVERLAPLERSLLRLALYEIAVAAVPPEVAVDEAVRLARRYATDEAGAFVNGILGAYVRAQASE
jgi:N utilization substance protein B